LGVSDTITPHVLNALSEREIAETKAIATARPPGDAKASDVELTQGSRRFASSQRAHARAASKQLEKEIGRFTAGIGEALRKYRNGDWSKTKAETRASIIFKDVTRTAYQLGTKSVGLVKPTGSLYDLTPSENRWIDSYIKEEFGYFKKFLAQAPNISDKQLKYRLGLYAAAMRSVYESGRVLSVGEDVLITWVLQSDEPCPDCQTLARNNPYTVNTLPTTPKAGQTRCRGNCYCSLKIDKVSKKEVDKVEKTHRSAKYVLRKIKQQQRRRK